MEMKHKGISLGTVTPNTMLDACAKFYVNDRASLLVEETRQTAVELDVITNSTLVKGYCCEGDVDQASRVMEAKKLLVDGGLRLLAEMRVACIAPSNFTLSIIGEALWVSTQRAGVHVPCPRAR